MSTETTPRFAIVHTSSGMLLGLGHNEEAAWDDARREADLASIPEPTSDDHHVAVAQPGHHWEIGGSPSLAEPVEVRD